jgi:hypothetical protein
MKVLDDQLWSLQLAEFDVDEMSQKFRDFLVFWADTAETILIEEPEISLREGVSKAFEVAEQTFGFLSTDWIGQMFLVLVQYWDRGQELQESLSVWEQRMVEQATALKLVELQESARLVTEDTGQTGLT